MLAIPFNNQPESTSVETTTYTIASGKYARVTLLDQTDDFEIDSVVAISGAEVTGSASTSSTGLKYTNNTGNILTGVIYHSASIAVNITAVSAVFSPYGSATNPSSNISIGNSTMSAGATGGREVILYPSDTIRVITSDANNTLNWKLYARDARTEAKQFWLPSGTQIDGTKFLVELFNELT